MMRLRLEELTAYDVKVEGGPNLIFDCGRHHCGGIRDGISFNMGGRGVIVISYKDLLQMAEKAKAWREKYNWL